MREKPGKSFQRIDVAGVNAKYLDAALISSVGWEKVDSVIKSSPIVRTQLKLTAIDLLDKNKMYPKVVENLPACYKLYNELVRSWMGSQAKEKKLKAICISMVGFEEHLESSIQTQEVEICDAINYIRLVQKSFQVFLPEILDRYRDVFLQETSYQYGAGFVGKEKANQALNSKKSESKVEINDKVLQKENKRLIVELEKLRTQLKKEEEKNSRLQQTCKEIQKKQSILSNEKSSLNKEVQASSKVIAKMESEAKFTQSKLKMVEEDNCLLNEQLRNLTSINKELDRNVAGHKKKLDSLFECNKFLCDGAPNKTDQLYVDLLNFVYLDDFLLALLNVAKLEVQADIQIAFSRDFIGETMRNIQKSDALTNLPLKSDRSEILAAIEEVITKCLGLEMKVTAENLEEKVKSRHEPKLDRLLELKRPQKIIRRYASYQFIRDLLGGRVPELGVSLSEGVVKRLDLDDGDEVYIKTSRVNDNGETEYIFGLWSRAKMIREIKIECVQFGIIEKDMNEKLTVSRTYSGDEIVIDNEKVCLQLMDEDVERLNLSTGDVVELAFYREDYASVRVRRTYLLEKVLETTIYKKLFQTRKREKTHRNNDIKKAVSTIFESKTICVIGCEGNHKYYRKDIESLGGKLVGINGDAPNQLFTSRVKKSDIVIFLTAHMSHAAFWKGKEVCREFDVPYAILENIASQAVVEKARRLLQMESCLV